MTKRIANFREGDLNENYGILALKEIGFVASIPREEDTGIDAIVTLNIQIGRFLYPDRSFSVQIKSKGKTEFNWNSERVSWFKKQELPFLWGIWDKESKELTLYSTVNLIQVTVINSGISFTLKKENQEFPNNIWLGEPIAKLTLGMETEKKNICRSTIKDHLNAEYLVRQFLNVFVLNLKYYWDNLKSPKCFKYNNQGSLFGETYDKESDRLLPLSNIIDYGNVNPNLAYDASLLKPIKENLRISNIASAVRMLIIQTRSEIDEDYNGEKLGLTFKHNESLSEIYQLLIKKGSFITEPPHL